MSIASAIVAKQQQVADAYTAISNKGGTLPQTQDMTNMATAIASIPSGTTPTGTISITTNGTYDVTNYATADVSVSGGGGTKYGCTIDTLLGDVDANGYLNYPNVSSNVVFNGVKDLGDDGILQYKFYHNNGVNSASFPDLTTISGSNGLAWCFSYSSITSIDFPKLETITGNSGLANFARQCPNLTQVNISKLKKASASSSMTYAFYRTAIQELRFTALEDISANYVLQSALGYCRSLTDVYFNALKTTSFGSRYTNQFTNMMSNTGTTVTHTIHFPSNLQSTISGLNGYPLFGGTSGYVTLSFDLPATS